jgi:HTH-type transcriptional regulator/antitoxin HigA
LKEIESHFEKEPEPNSIEGDRFDVLAALIETYEVKRWPIEPVLTNVLPLPSH